MTACGRQETVFPVSYRSTASTGRSDGRAGWSACRPGGNRPAPSGVRQIAKRCAFLLLVLSSVSGCVVEFPAGQTNPDGNVACGNGVLEPGEVCDDGNTEDLDNCRSDCLQDMTQCGNGGLDPGETCDDSNIADGDGCSQTCQVEPCGQTWCLMGCCDSSGACLPGTQDLACGTGAGACDDCTAAGLVCQNQHCEALGPCTPGQTQECGNCGTRRCQQDSQWGSCEAQGECSRDQVQTGEMCGRCGHMERVCSADCAWGEWACVDEQGVCQPSQVELGSACVNCGQQERTCLWNCTWGQWICTGQGVCPAGTLQTQTCDCGGGERSRTCTQNCQWGNWSSCDPPECNGFGTCQADGTCACNNGYAGLYCERCNEPDDFYGYPNCNHDTPGGSCTCELQPKPGYQICNEMICRVVSNGCNGCGGSPHSACRACTVDPNCSTCFCSCTCTVGDTIYESCGGGLARSSMCESGGYWNHWSAWSSCQ